VTFDEHIEDIVSRCKKRLNLLKALCGRTWGASTVTIMYTYKSFIRPILEYGSILYAYSSDDLIKKIQAVETQAIKIAHRLPPWTTNTKLFLLSTLPVQHGSRRGAVFSALIIYQSCRDFYVVFTRYILVHTSLYF
jgi:hypothetical protein